MIYDKDFEHMLQMKKHEILGELERVKNHMILEMSGVDKCTLTKLRSIIAEYDKLEKQIVDKINYLERNQNSFTGNANTSYDTFVKEIETAVQEFERKVNEDYKTFTETYGERTTKLEQLTRGFVSPEMFGAIGDGVADDTQALQNTINYCQTNECVMVCNSKNVYAITSPIEITALCVLNFNFSEIKAINEMPCVVLVKTPTKAGYRGLLERVTINANYKAVSGLEIQQNINCMQFKDIDINDPITYGIYGNGGMGKFTDIILRNRSRHLGSYGLYIKSPDAVITNCMPVNFQYGAYVQAMTQFINFHPWNSFKELMTNSIGVICKNTSVTLDTSYIDTFAQCFNTDGGQVYVNNCFFFWSTEYYTDETIDDDNFLPSICNNGLTVFMTNCRIISLRGTTRKIVFATERNYTRYNFNDNNLYEGLKEEPLARYEVAQPTLLENYTLFSENDPILRRNKEITLDMVIKYVGSETLTFENGRTKILSLPSGYRPKFVKHFPIMIGTQYAAREMGYGYISLTGDLMIKPLSGELPTNSYIYINYEFLTTSNY